jgi:hypothetical protein
MTINGTLANLNAALNGLTFKPAAIGAATIVLSYTDVGTNQMATATIKITVLKSGFKPGNSPSSAAAQTSPTGGGTVTSTPTSGSTTTDQSAIPPDALTQWQGVAAAVDVLNG